MFKKFRDKYDKNVVGRWYEDYAPLMKRVAYDILEDRELAKDMVQTAFERVIDKYEVIYKLSDKARILYLKKIVKNLCLDYIRKNQLNIINVSDMDDIVDRYDIEIPLDEMEPVETHIDLKRNLDKLDERDRLLLMAKYMWELSEVDISAMSGIKPNSVHTYISRARKKLLEIMGEEVQDNES